MYHLVNNYQDKSGNALAGYYVKLKVPGGAYAPLFADESSTPIVAVSGVADTAVTNANGLFDLYVADGTYDVEFYDRAEPTRRISTVPGVPMFTLALGPEDVSAAVAAAAEAVISAAGASDSAEASDNSATASAASATAAAVSAADASAAADAAVLASGIYADEPTGNAAVADNVNFAAVGSTSAKAIDIWKRVSAGVSTLLRTYPDASTLTNVLKLDSAGAINHLVAVETKGRAVAPVAGTVLTNCTRVFADPVLVSGYITRIRVFGLNGGGTLTIKRFTKSGTTVTQVGSDTNVAIAAGVNDISAAIAINAGEYIGWYAFSGTGKVGYTAATTADGTGWYQIGTSTSGNVSTGTVGTISTTNRIEMGFEISSSTFQSTLPGRVTAAEAYATPFKAGTTALQDITGAITVFNAREKKDIAGGKVCEWYSQDRKLVATAEARSGMPTFTTGLSPYIDFGTAAGLRAYPKAKLREVRHLPDSTTSPFAYPPGGFVCTGSAMRDDGKLLVVNDGRTSTNASSWGASDNASLFILDRGTLAKRYEFDLKAATGGVGFLQTAQGIDWTYDGTNYFYWIADTPAAKVRCLRDNNDGTLTHISANDITPNSGMETNGVAIDRTAGEIYIGSGKDIVTDPTNGQRIDVHNYTTKAFVRTFICHVDVDQLCLVYPESVGAATASTTTFASTPYLFCTSGGNGEYPDVVVYTKSGKLVTVYHNLVGPQSVEGIIVDYKTGTFLIFHDGGYHPQGDNDCSVMAIYDVELPVAGLCPDAVLLGLFGRLKTGTSTPFFGFEDATAGRAGWGLRSSGSGTLQLATSERAASIFATAPATLTSWFTAVLAVLPDGTVQARINSASATVTGSLAGLDYGLTGGAMVLGAERTESGALAGQGFVEIACAYHGSLDDISGNQASIDARALALENAMKAAYPELVGA